MMTTRTASMTFALAITCAAAACQRPIEGKPCPCLSGYRCCDAEQACYPEGVRCPGAVPGKQAWTAAGVPTFDPGGNIYVDEEEALLTHKISLIDKDNGKARWTQEGYVGIRCVKDDIAAFLQMPFGANGPPTQVQPKLFGVSNATGTQQWSVDLTGRGFVGCSDNGAYVLEPSASSNNSILNVHAMRDGTITWSVPFGAPAEAPVDPDVNPPAYIASEGDHLVIVIYPTGEQIELQALDLPDGQQGSVRWTLPFQVESVSYIYNGPDRIFVELRDRDVYSLVRLALSDGSRMWTHSIDGDGSAWIAPSWPGIVLLMAGTDLVALSSDTGVELWKVSLNDLAGNTGTIEFLNSGEMLIAHYDYDADPFGTKSCKLLGPDGQVRWQFGPVSGSVYDAGAGEYFLLDQAVLSRVHPGGTVDWELGVENGRQVVEIHGHDEENVFVRLAPQDEGACGSPCYQQLAAVARRDGTVSWISEPFASQSAYDTFRQLHTDAERVYVFTPIKGSLTTGTLWAFWR